MSIDRAIGLPRIRSAVQAAARAAVHRSPERILGHLGQEADARIIADAVRAEIQRRKMPEAADGSDGGLELKAGHCHTRRGIGGGSAWGGLPRCWSDVVPRQGCEVLQAAQVLHA